MTLHTWGRQLTLHPHTHCLVSAGGLDATGRWQGLGQFLLPGGVIRKVYRGKIQALIQAAFKEGQWTLPPNLSGPGFWSLYRRLYRKDWCVRIEPRYEHGKGVVLYLARYCKGGPLHPDQIKTANHQAIEMSYLDHRTQRIKRQRLKPMDFMQRLLQHVPPKGLHTARYYGLYASASKHKYTQCRELHGTVGNIKPGYRSQIRSMLLYCPSCGSPAQLSHRRWPDRRKGISINKDALGDRASGHVQQDDERNIAREFHEREPFQPSG